VRAALEEACVFSLPCRVAPDGDRDSQPLVVKEAMAMGLPVVGTAEVAMPEMVDESNGRLVPPEDIDALADALAQLAALDEDDLRALGEAGRRRVEAEFRLDEATARLLEHFELP
jgi:colanic acid/amylovoran biosynthesis glycosyltransferase